MDEAQIGQIDEDFTDFFEALDFEFFYGSPVNFFSDAFVSVQMELVFLKSQNLLW